MALLDLLSALTGTQDQPTTVSEPTVTAPRRDQPNDPVTMQPPSSGPGPMADQLNANPQPAPNPYDNHDAVLQARQANMQNQPQPGGMTSPGLYGLLPKNLQHGTLRSVLGAISDAMLVQGGLKPAYANSMERQQLGDAMAGVDIEDPASVRAAASRIGVTGAVGAPEMADKLQEQSTQAGLKRAQLEYTSDYHQQLVNANRSRTMDTMAPKIQGMFYGVTDPNEYARKYAAADQIARRIDPDSNAEIAFGLVPPDEWQPGMSTGVGMTQNQNVVSSDKGEQRQVQMRGQDIGYRGRIDSARIGAGSRIQGANISANRPSSTTLLQRLIEKQNNGETLTPAESAAFDRLTSVPRTSRRASAGGGTSHSVTRAQLSTLGPGAINGPSGGQPQFVNGRVYTDAHGNHARYQNGKWIPL